MTRSLSLLRGRGSHDSGKVGMVELFFDLVFVFAVTQLSHSLLANLTALGAVHVGLLLVAVWWVWIFTSWVTNWLDPERIAIRIGLFVLMVAGLLLSVSIPHAFTDRGLLFAGPLCSCRSRVRRLPCGWCAPSRPAWRETFSAS